MAYSENLSNYDKEHLKRIRESKLLIVDLDGTLIDFEKIDNMIISYLFPDNRLINSIDNILWKVNNLDVFGNGYSGLKLRLAFYSLFCKRSYKECKKIYADMYSKLSQMEFIDVYISTLKELIDNDYKVIILTKNVYAKKLLESNIFGLDKKVRKNLQLLILKKEKKKQFKKIVQQYGKVCVIGNNLSDDVFSSYNIRSPYIYIGESKIVKGILKLSNCFFDRDKESAINRKGICLRNFRQVKEIFKRR